MGSGGVDGEEKKAPSSKEPGKSLLISQTGTELTYRSRPETQKLWTIRAIHSQVIVLPRGRPVYR
jgi:hypothetical protein